jgi:UDP-N-acetylmuramate dehydrogenase
LHVAISGDIVIVNATSAGISLQSLNTFGIDVTAQHLHTVTSEVELRVALLHPDTRNQPVLILGGGSNVLFTGNWNGVVILNRIEGLKTVVENGSYVIVEAGAGEGWHQLVMYCVAREYGGIENLSLIPGSVGAAPMQNIGAYGVELKDVFHSLDAMDRRTGDMRTFSDLACCFGYRESIFKRELKDRYVITRVRLKLTKPGHHVLKTGYGAITEELNKAGITNPTIGDISNAVIAIRRSKLPDPAELGNAGSFFKNPTVEAGIASELNQRYPSMPAYPQEDGTVKLAAGWLIEQCGWKGKCVGNCGVHDKQALVLVNYGGATGSEIYHLSETILQDVHRNFGIMLEREVNII